MIFRERQDLAPLAPAAKQLYDAIRAKGYTPHGVSEDLRDAAHEAHHALFCRLRKPWTRDRIHDALCKQANRLRRLRNGELVSYELDARAVEWIICEQHGIEHSVSSWAEMTWWETSKNMNIMLPGVEWIAENVTKRKELTRIKDFAANVQALVKAPSKKLSPDELLTAIEGPTQLCAQCGNPREGHKYRHTFKAAP